MVALPGDSALCFRGLHGKRFLTIFFIASFIYPLICALIIYVQHNASALGLLGVQGARGLISINVTFFMSLLGWQSMLALFLAAFIGPGLVSPDLANNALSLYLARPFSRVEYVLGKMSVLVILMSLMTWVPGLLCFGLQGYLEGWQWMQRQRAPRLRHLLRRVGLDPAAGAAGAGALRLGEVEARGRRPDVRRLFRGRGIRRRHQRGAAHQVGQPLQHQPPGRRRSGCSSSKARATPPTARSSSACSRARNCRCGACWMALAACALICLYMLARKIRGAEVVR